MAVCTKLAERALGACDELGRKRHVVEAARQRLSLVYRPPEKFRKRLGSGAIARLGWEDDVRERGDRICAVIRGVDERDACVVRRGCGRGASALGRERDGVE